MCRTRRRCVETGEPSDAMRSSIRPSIHPSIHAFVMRAGPRQVVQNDRGHDRRPDPQGPALPAEPVAPDAEHRGRHQPVRADQGLEKGFGQAHGAQPAARLLAAHHQLGDGRVHQRAAGHDQEEASQDHVLFDDGVSGEGGAQCGQAVAEQCDENRLD